MDLNNLSNIVGADVLKKAYEDAVSEPAKEVGKIGVDFVKTFRLFTLPFQYLALFQDRLSMHLEKVRAGVPKENQIEASPSIAGPVIEKLKYLEDENHLTEMYLQLLQRAIDKERVSEAHPAFFNIIEQLSPDEAMILYKLSFHAAYMEYRQEYDYESNVEKKKNRTCFGFPPFIDELAFKQYFEMYLSHLSSLNLVAEVVAFEQNINYHNDFRTSEKRKVSSSIRSDIHLTHFGYLFVQACIPPKGFALKAK